MEQTTTDNGKTIAIIAYITLIGWIIALVMHNNNKTALGAYHIRQMLGIMLLGLALSLLGSLLDIYILSVRYTKLCRDLADCYL